MADDHLNRPVDPDYFQRIRSSGKYPSANNIMQNIGQGLILLITVMISAAIMSCSHSHTHDAKATLALPTGTLPEDGSTQLLELTNQARAAKKLPILTVDPRLTMAALDHSSSMHRYQFFDHQGRDGNNFQSRMLRHGYPRSHSAENIAMVHDPRLVFKMWHESRGHYKNMFNKKYTRIGIGRAGNYWTAVYAAPDGT